jgi:hypothetical protein
MTASDHLSPGQFSDDWNNAPPDDTDYDYYTTNTGHNAWTCEPGCGHPDADTRMSDYPGPGQRR